MTTDSKKTVEAESKVEIYKSQFLIAAQNADPRLAIIRHPVKSVLAAAAVGVFIALESPSSNPRKGQNKSSEAQINHGKSIGSTGSKIVRLSHQLAVAMRFATRFGLPLAEHFASGFASAQQSQARAGHKSGQQTGGDSVRPAQQDEANNDYAQTRTAKGTA